MTNDAKLGMLAGVLGVIVAAVLFTKAPPPAGQSKPDETAKPVAKEAAQEATMSTPPAATPASVPPRVRSDLPSTPVVRTRKDVEAQPTSLSGGADEEP
jgi:hypothetical protein